MSTRPKLEELNVLDDFMLNAIANDRMWESHSSGKYYPYYWSGRLEQFMSKPSL